MSHFLMAFQRHDGGSAVSNADELLTRLLEEVTRFGGKGKIVVEAELAPNGDHGVEVTFQTKATFPKRAQGRAFYFRDDAGLLTRTPPPEEQALRPVPDHKKEG